MIYLALAAPTRAALLDIYATTKKVTVAELKGLQKRITIVLIDLGFGRGLASREQENWHHRAAVVVNAVLGKMKSGKLDGDKVPPARAAQTMNCTAVSMAIMAQERFDSRLLFKPSPR